MSGRAPPPPTWTIRALHAGGLLAVGSLAAAVGFRILGVADKAELAALIGVLLLIGSPVAGLVATLVEVRRSQPAAAVMAAVVLAILGAAAVAAILTT